MELLPRDHFARQTLKPLSILIIVVRDDQRLNVDLLQPDEVEALLRDNDHQQNQVVHEHVLAVVVSGCRDVVNATINPNQLHNLREQIRVVTQVALKRTVPDGVHHVGDDDQDDAEALNDLGHARQKVGREDDQQFANQNDDLPEVELWLRAEEQEAVAHLDLLHHELLLLVQLALVVVLDDQLDQVLVLSQLVDEEDGNADHIKYDERNADVLYRVLVLVLPADDFEVSEQSRRAVVERDARERVE